MSDKDRYYELFHEVEMDNTLIIKRADILKIIPKAKGN